MVWDYSQNGAGKFLPRRSPPTIGSHIQMGTSSFPSVHEIQGMFNAHEA